MTGDGSGLRAIVLAAQRPGVTNPLAARFGVSHKCLVPLRAEPLIAHVVRTLAHHPRVATVAIAVEEEAFSAVRRAVAQTAGDARIELVPAASNLADSVVAAVGKHDGPVLITTADHPLLSPDAVEQMADALHRTDAAIAMTPRDAVLAANAEGQRRFYEFRDDAYSNCNLYGLSGRRALQAAEVFRGGGQFAKSAARIINAFGLINLLLLRLKVLSLQEAMARISGRLQLTLSALVLDDGCQAIDVDNDRTYRVVEQILASRPARVLEHA